jgi:hypothetical protein
LSAGKPGPYARAVQEALARARGRPALLSSRDWARVADWCARGVPLSVVLEALAEAASRARRRGTEIRGLALVAPAVEESWRAVAGGRRRTEPPPGPPRAAEPELEPATEEQMARVSAEVDRALAAFRGRMSEEVFAETRRRAVSQALRRARRSPPRTT